MNPRHDPTDLEGQRESRRDEESLKRLARKREIEDIKWLMSSRQGRRVMWRLLDLSGPTRLSFNTNAMQMAFNEGNRNLGLQLLDELMKACPEQYRVMAKEQQDDRDGNGSQSK